MEEQLILEYWNDFKHYDDGLRIFLSAKKLTTEEFFNYVENL